jgi:hypothetical protein
MTASRQVSGGAWAANASSTAPKAALTSAGTNQATGALIQHEYAEFGTVAASSAAVLPTSQQIGGLTAGDAILVANMGANALLVFPPVGGKINLLSANASLSVASGKTVKFIVSVTSPLNWVAIVSA